MAIAVSCAAPGSTPDGDGLVKVVLPEGDAAAGQQTFLDLQCTSCHALAGRGDFPTPASEVGAPDLTKSLAGQNRGQIATSVMNPAHTSSVSLALWAEWTESQRIWIGPMEPPEPAPEAARKRKPMTDYRAVMTVQELCDLVSFLKANAESPP